ncbi:MAG: hypothetical protein ACREBR_03175 [bacterium]
MDKHIIPAQFQENRKDGMERSLPKSSRPDSTVHFHPTRFSDCFDTMRHQVYGSI